MMITSVAAMVLNVRGFYETGQHLLLAVGGLLLVLAVWLAVEGGLCFHRLGGTGRGGVSA